MELADAKIWVSKNASLCRVFANQVTLSIGLNQRCQEDFWGPGQGFEMRPLHNSCELILHRF